MMESNIIVNANGNNIEFNKEKQIGTINGEPLYERWITHTGTTSNSKYDTTITLDFTPSIIYDISGAIKENDSNTYRLRSLNHYFASNVYSIVTFEGNKLYLSMYGAGKSAEYYIKILYTK